MPALSRVTRHCYLQAQRASVRRGRSRQTKCRSNQLCNGVSPRRENVRQVVCRRSRGYVKMSADGQSPVRHARPRVRGARWWLRHHAHPPGFGTSRQYAVCCARATTPADNSGVMLRQRNTTQKMRRHAAFVAAFARQNARIVPDFSTE